CKRVRQPGSITIGQVGTGGSGREWSGSQARDQTGEVNRGPDQAGSATNQSDRNRNRNAGNKIQGPMETHTKAQTAGLAILNTPAISLRFVLADCRIESLIAESTRWPALVLQPTRQVSPTIIGKSIPDRGF
ncbi:unnamed protein product, partial [Staurois parvus]